MQSVQHVSAFISHFEAPEDQKHLLGNSWRKAGVSGLSPTNQQIVVLHVCFNINADKSDKSALISISSRL